MTNQPPGSRAAFTFSVTRSMSRHSCIEMLLITTVAGSSTVRSSSALWTISTRSASPAAATRSRACATECRSPSTPTTMLRGYVVASRMTPSPAPQAVSTTRTPASSRAASPGTCASPPGTSRT
jgi:hypothetical protein